MTPTYTNAELIAMVQTLHEDLRIANEKRNQLAVQLAGCSVAATGWNKEPAVKGDYGWSPWFRMQQLCLLDVMQPECPHILSNSQGYQGGEDSQEPQKGGEYFQ